MFEIIRAFFAAAAAVALLAFGGIALGGSCVALVLSTPLFLIFSPILVPATIATTLLATGFGASGIFGTVALTIFRFIFKRVTGISPPKIPGISKVVYAKKEKEEKKGEKKKKEKKGEKKDGKEGKKKAGKKQDAKNAAASASESE